MIDVNYFRNILGGIVQSIIQRRLDEENGLTGGIILRPKGSGPQRSSEALKLIEAYKKEQEQVKVRKDIEVSISEAIANYEKSLVKKRMESRMESYIYNYD